MSYKSIMNTGYDQFKRNWTNQMVSFVIISLITTVLILPCSFLIVYGDEISNLYITWTGIVLIVFISLMFVTYVVGSVYYLDHRTDNNEIASVNGNMKFMYQKSANLIGLTVIYSIIFGALAYLSNLLDTQFNNNLALEITSGSILGIICWLISIPWFFGVGYIIIENHNIIDSFVRSWKNLFYNFIKLVSVTFLAIVPIIISVGIIVALGLTMPSGSLTLIWAFIIVVDSFVMAFALIPWSINILYPLFQEMKDKIPS